MRKVLLLLLLALPLSAAEITRNAVLEAMNSYRADKGLPPLKFDARLQKAADDRMRDMEEQEYWAHESPDGRSPFTWVRSEGYDFEFAGENLAAGFETTEIMVASWMESPGHRANIMSPLYADCAIAIIDGSTRGRAAGKSVVVLFGRTHSPDAQSVATKE